MGIRSTQYNGLCLALSLLLAAGAGVAQDPPAAGDNSPTQELHNRKATLDDAHQRFMDYYAEEQYQLALVAAAQVVEHTHAIYGEASLEAGLALTNLATAQAKLGDHPAALMNYQASVAIIEATQGIISPRLVNPLLGVAAEHNAMENYDLGLAVYERALRIYHVEHGLFNVDQMKIRDGLTESYVGLGDMQNAGFQQQVQAMIIRQEHGDDLELVVPAVFKLAEWYQRTNQPEKEQQQYTFAVNAIRQLEGQNSTLQINALRGLSAAYMRSVNQATSIRLLKQAIRLNETSAEPDPVLTADILIELGDNYSMLGSMRDARRVYQSAWQILAEEDEADKLHNNYFGTPVGIRAERLPDVYPSRSKNRKLLHKQPDAFLTGYVNISYDIDKSGRVKNVEVLESDPPGLIDKRIKILVSRIGYRPRMVDGEPVATPNNRLSHEFMYLAGEIEEDDTDDEKGERIELPTSTTGEETG
ncbi:MAG: energy transducer TonB [Gammaproteobacteria bacterium]|jgi:tetratricopeptide (TPR) repeat protein|nr:energy transducer TonB [Gammaproteobacteria bacterium]MDP6616224.1 energy transducer TonB [Gammaproteobacteria bacterium]MDP6695568.1 energy transducer TonB [Gammaproteobacteria bacterium]